MRHSKGDSCQLSFSAQAGNLHICLRDNGTQTDIKEGNGISGLRERLAAINATLTLQQHPGLTATIELPLQASLPLQETT
jgi:two-component system sensor histidine kinase DesK